MKKIIFIFIFILGAKQAFCLDQFRDFKNYITAGAVKPFARDLGGLLGSAIYHKGRVLGFPGFDVGVRGIYQLEASDGNTIFTNSGITSFGFPFVQAEIGMPIKMDGFIRATSFQGFTMSGGGLKIALTKINDMPNKFQAMLILSGHAAVHESFSAVHFGGGFVFSWNFPSLEPYLGIGGDRTRLSVKEAPAGSGALGATETVYETRFTLGFNSRISRYAYFSVAANMLHGKPAIETSAGIRF